MPNVPNLSPVQLAKKLSITQNATNGMVKIRFKIYQGRLIYILGPYLLVKTEAPSIVLVVYDFT